MTESDFIAVVTPVITIIIGVTTLGGFMYKIGSWINQKAEAKAAALQLITDKNNAEFKRYTDEKWTINHQAILDINSEFKDLKSSGKETALNLKQYNETTAASLAKVALDTAASVSKVAIDTARSLADYNTSIRDSTEKREKTLNERLDKLDTKIEQFTSRQDLVNTNVGNIGLDISELQEDVIELYSAEDIENERTDNGRDVEIDRGHGRDGLSARKNKKRLEIERRKKRRQIETDRVSQDHPLHGTGRR